MAHQAAAGPDDLLAFRGRPSLYFPAVRAGSGGAAGDSTAAGGGFPARLASGLGTAKFLLGACLALLGGMAVYVQAWSAWTYGGIWSGMFAIFTGLCVILAARRQKPERKSLLVALLVLSILGFFNTGLLATFTAMGLVAEVYMEDAAGGGGLVWKGVENASPFVVQLLLLATATADSLLSLACCVISGREVCCCGKPTPALLDTQRRDRLISWLGSQHDPHPHHHQQKVLHLPPVHLVPSMRRSSQGSGRPKTPSTLRVFPVTAADLGESPPSSANTSTQLDTPLVRADQLDASKRERRRHAKRQQQQHRQGGPGRAESLPGPTATEAKKSHVSEKYLALDKKLSEEFIDRSLIFERSRLSTR